MHTFVYNDIGMCIHFANMHAYGYCTLKKKDIFFQLFLLWGTVISRPTNKSIFNRLYKNNTFTLHRALATLSFLRVKILIKKKNWASREMDAMV